MSSTPNPTVSSTTTPQTPEQQALTLLHQQITKLSSHHVTVSYTLIAVLAGVIALAGVGGWLGLKFADRQIARAEAAEKRSEQLVQNFEQQLKQDTAQRDQDTKQQQAIVKIVDTRDQSTDSKIQQVLSPKVDAQQAITDLNNAYAGQLSLAGTPVTPDNRISFTVPTVQQFSATKIDRDRLFADRTDIQRSLSLEQDKTKTLNNDLLSCQVSLTGDEKTIKEWKSAAKKSKFRKFLDGAKTAAEIGVALVAGYEIGHRL